MTEAGRSQPKMPQQAALGDPSPPTSVQVLRSAPRDGAASSKAWEAPARPQPGSAPDLWVFGYGSLMWHPGFAHEEAVPALLHGAHRALCIYSVVHRGRPGRPGLVLGLDVGGLCRGVAFRVSAGAERATRQYLQRRERVTQVYRTGLRRVDLLDGSGRAVRALCHLVDRRHRQYAGRLPLPEQVRLVRAARGRSGANLDYLVNTLRHLDALGIEDAPLLRLLGLFGGRRRLRG